MFVRGESQGWSNENLENTPLSKDGRVPCLSGTGFVSLPELTAETETVIREHLRSCDFCCAELRLLAHHQPVIVRYPVPEIPMNLRILAESILNRG